MGTWFEDVSIEGELKPCPFCGSSGKMVKLHKTHQYHPMCSRDNQKSGMCLCQTYPNPDEDGFIFRDDAVKVWNQRPEQPAFVHHIYKYIGG